MDLKYLKNDYVAVGQIATYPIEIIDKMIEKQVEQGNAPDVAIFENSIHSNYDDLGFDWERSSEGFSFWLQVIKYKNFHCFYKKYPRTELPLPRVIEVRDSEEETWAKRVVIAFKKNRAICWTIAETIEEAEDELATSVWSYWREVGEHNDEDNEDAEESTIKSEYEPYDFSGGIEDYTHLLGKRIISKDNKSSEIIGQIDYSDGLSLINGVEVDYYFDEYTFEDGSVVGELILKNKIRKKLD